MHVKSTHFVSFIAQMYTVSQIKTTVKIFFVITLSNFHWIW